MAQEQADAPEQFTQDLTLPPITKLQDDLSNTRQHPFLSDDLMKKLAEVLKEVTEELGATKKLHANRTREDEIQQAISALFDGRVGAPYPNEELETICKDGELRYTRKTPPGYKDSTKDGVSPEEGARERKFGDLIVWQQIMDKAKAAKKNVIFVSDDKKEDWWLESQGKTLGPRPELISEFLQKTEQRFHMYQADRFLEFASQRLQQKITPESLGEIRDLRQHDITRRKELMDTEEAMLRKRRLRIGRDERVTLAAHAADLRQRIHESHSRMALLDEKEKQIRQWLVGCEERMSDLGGRAPQSLDGFLEVRRNLEHVKRDQECLRLDAGTLERVYAMLQEARARVTSLEEQDHGVRAR